MSKNQSRTSNILCLLGDDSTLAAGVDAATQTQHANEDRNIAERQLRETHETLRALVHASPIAVCTVGLDRRVGTVWNSASERLFGWSAQEVRGGPLPIVSEEKRRESDELLDRLLEGQDLTGVEIVGRRRDGEELHIRLDGAPMRDANGRISGAVAFMTDVTTATHHRESLERSRDNLQAIFDGAPVMQYALDLEGRFVEVNREFESVTEVPRQEALGRTVSELGLVESGVARELEEAIRAACSGELVDRLTIPLTTVSGRRAVVEATAKRATLLERDLIMGFAVDVSERRNLQQQLVQTQKLDAIGRVAGGVAHDFNNILTAINGYLHLARSTVEVGTKTSGYLENVQKASARASKLTEQLLLFGKHAPNELTPVDLNESVVEMTKMLSRVIGENIELEVDLSADSTVVRGDSGLLGQVLMNLVLNARDAMPDGGVLLIRTSLEACTAPARDSEDASEPRPNRHAGECVRLSVADSGIGMDAATIARAYEPFFTTKGRDKGTGLGLPVVYGIVEQHAGWITIDSTPGAGSRFDVYFPAESAETITGSSSIVAGPSRRRVEATILLVEDDAAIRGMVLESLSPVVSEVRVCQSIEAAMRLTDSGFSPDVVVTDVMLPDGYGTSLRERLNLDVPFVYTSGYFEDHAEIERLRATGARILPKPFEIDELLTAIVAILEGGDHEFVGIGD